MATAAVIPPQPSGNHFVDSGAHAGSEEWYLEDEPMTDEEKVKYLQEVIKKLGDPANQKEFIKAMTELGTRAVDTTNAFNRIKTTMHDFVKDHGVQFPGIIPFCNEWDGYVQNWRDYVDKSHDVANVSAAEYMSYTSYLKSANTDYVKTKEDLEKLAAAFKKFSENKPISGIDLTLKNKFLDLRDKVGHFQTRVNEYFDDQQVKLTQLADGYRKEIEGLKLEIDGLNIKIERTTNALKIGSWWGGPILVAVAGGILAQAAKDRREAQTKLDKAESNLKTAEKDLKDLAVMKAQFHGLIPDFKLLSDNLGLFADVWNSFHNQADAFATQFKQLVVPIPFPPILENQIKLALDVASPLSEGLKEYASKIHN